MLVVIVVPVVGFLRLGFGRLVDEGCAAGGWEDVRESLLLFLGLFRTFFLLEEEGEPDANLVKDIHWHGQKSEGEGIGGGGDDGGNDDDCEDGVGAGGAHHLVGQDA